MRAKLINESFQKPLNEAIKIQIPQISDKIKDKFPILKTLAFGKLAELLNKEGHLLLRAGKLDFQKLYKRLHLEPWWKRDYKETVNFIHEVAPAAGIVKYIPGLSSDERKELKSQEKIYTSDLDPIEFSNAEIDENLAGPEDYLVRNTQGAGGEPAFYRFEDEDGNPRTLNDKEITFLRRIYTEEKGTWNPKNWKDKYNYYLYVSPIKIKNIGTRANWGKDLSGGFQGEVYD